MKTKCNKCDERGYIQDTEIKGAASSCECGWAIEQQYKQFNKFFGSNPIEQLDNLLAYGQMRYNEKAKQI